MNYVVPLNRFKAEAESCNHFLLTYEDALSATSFSILFDQIAVCLSASPYIALKNSTAKLCISHIDAIKRYGSTGDEKGFILMCNDYSADDAPIPVKFSLKCYKTS